MEILSKSDAVEPKDKKRDSDEESGERRQRRSLPPTIGRGFSKLDAAKLKQDLHTGMKWILVVIFS